MTQMRWVKAYDYEEGGVVVVNMRGGLYKLQYRTSNKEGHYYDWTDVPIEDGESG